MSGFPPPSISRTAVTLEPVFTRKDNQRITCIAVDVGGQRFFLGLENGYLEEHRLLRARFAVVNRFTAERRMFKKGIADICVCTPAQRLLLLSEDHVAAMCTMDSFDMTALPGVKKAAAITCEPGRRLPARIAVATLASKKPKLLVFSMVPGLLSSGTAGTAPVLLSAQAVLPDAPVQQLAWVGTHVVVAVTGGYWLYRGGETLVELSTNIPCAPLVSPVPQTTTAVLMFTERLALITDSSGAAIKEPLVLWSWPLAIGHLGQFMVAVCEDGIFVYDRNSTQQVQAMDFMHDDPWVDVNKRLASATDDMGGCMLLASSAVVWILEPIALEDQVAELLQRKKFTVAMDIIKSCGREGAPWAPVAYAEAGLLMLQDLKYEEAVVALELCTPHPFQPMELFPLFPVYTAQWLSVVPHKRYWGLSGRNITELSQMIEDTVEVQRAACSQDGITELGSAAGGALAVVPFDLLGEPEALKQLVHQFKLTAERHIVGYLMKVRSLPGVLHLDAVDTLIAHLLCDTDQEKLLEDFAQSRQQVVIPSVTPTLMATGRWHALALLKKQAGELEGALEIWRKLAEGSVKESESATGAVAEARGNSTTVAAQHMSELLQRQEGGVTTEVVLRYLPWLLQQEPDLILKVLKARQLPIADVQMLLEARDDDMRWLYLEHMVHEGKSEDAALHTRLGRNLVEAALKAERETGIHMPAGGPSSSEQENGVLPNGSTSRHLSMLRQRLQAHLSKSRLYDATSLLHMVEDTDLWEEQVELYRVLEAHASALKVLVLTLHDMDRALLYCRQYAGQEGFLTLLELCLNPGEGREPMYDAALRVLDAEGGDLNPMKVLHALGDTMPLHLAMGTLCRMLSTTLHRRRHLMIHRSLLRAQNLNARVEKLQQEAQRVVVTEATTCRACQRLLGNKVFYRYPTGLVICSRCYKDPDLPGQS